MGLKGLIQNSVASAFGAIDDIVTSTGIVYKRITGSNYNTVAGSNDIITSETNISGIIIGISSYERSLSGINPSAQKIICKQSDFSFEPLTSDTIEIDSVQWQILEIISDAADATYSFLLDIS